MEKPKLLYLTKIGKTVNEKGRKRIDQALEKEKNLNNAGSGTITKAWFEEQNLPVPKEYQDEIEDEIDEEGFINLSDEELEDTYTQVILNWDDFGMVVDGEDYSTIYTKSGMFVEIYECAADVNKQIKKLFRKLG